MRTVHNSTNLTIEFDTETCLYTLTVRFDEEAIAGHADGPCPRCGGHTRVVLWELEGPGGESNTIWLVCGGEKPCLLDGEPLRWSRPVTFERDWEDL